MGEWVCVRLTDAFLQYMTVAHTGGFSNAQRDVVCQPSHSTKLKLLAILPGILHRYLTVPEAFAP